MGGWRTLHRLWRDESGVVLSTEVVLLGTVLGAGTLVGLAQLRDSVVQELSDLSQVLADLNQSYSMSGVKGCSAETAGSSSGDLAPDLPAEDELTAAPAACVTLDGDPAAERRADGGSLPGDLET